MLTCTMCLIAVPLSLNCYSLSLEFCLLLALFLLLAILSLYLPPASEGWGKVMNVFSLSTSRGGSLSQRGGGGSAGGGGQLAGGVSQPGGGVSWRGVGGSAKIGQQNEYSLHGRRYASCVHAGGLSCLFHAEVRGAHLKPKGEMFQCFSYI